MSEEADKFVVKAMTKDVASVAARLARVEAEQRNIIAKFPGFEPETVKTQPFMVPFAVLTGWADELASIRAEVEDVAKELIEDGDPTCVEHCYGRLTDA